MTWKILSRGKAGIGGRCTSCDGFKTVHYTVFIAEDNRKHFWWICEDCILLKV